MNNNKENKMVKNTPTYSIPLIFQWRRFQNHSGYQQGSQTFSEYQHSLSGQGHCVVTHLICMAVSIRIPYKKSLDFFLFLSILCCLLSWHCWEHNRKRRTMDKLLSISEHIVVRKCLFANFCASRKRLCYFLKSILWMSVSIF